MTQKLALQLTLDPLPTTWCVDPETLSVGLQSGRDGVVRGDRVGTGFTFEAVVGVKEGPHGAPDFTGPLVHGRRGDRFLYVTWGTPTAPGGHEMFRRLKLHLTPVTRKDWSAPGVSWEQIHAGRPLLATVSGACPDGTPNCGTGRALWRAQAGP